MSDMSNRGKIKITDCVVENFSINELLLMLLFADLNNIIPGQTLYTM